MTKDLDGALLRGFVEAARVGSIGRAGENLGRSQPLMTQQIRRLEDIVGCRLLVRTPRGVFLTQEGHTFLPYAQRILSVGEDAVRRLSWRGKGGQGRARIRLSEDLAGDAVLKSLLAMAPASFRLDLEVVTAEDRPPASAFEEGEVDIFFGDPLPFDANLKPAKVATARLVWAASPNFDLDRRPLPLALYPAACTWRSRIAEALDADLIDWYTAVEGSSLSALQSAARSSAALTACLISALGEGLIAIDHAAFGLPEPPEVEIALYRSSRVKPEAGLEALENVLWNLVATAEA